MSLHPSSLRRALVASAALALAAVAGAQPPATASYPAKPVTMVVPFAAGSVTDLLARIVAQRLGDVLGQPVVVENKAGADGNIGAAYAAAAAPDGYTLMMGAASTNAINPSLHKNLKFNALKDLSGELFKTMAQVPDFLHIPYKGGSAPVTDVMGGRVSAMFCNLPLCLPHIRAGKLQALAVTSARRTPLLPEVPTIAESGVPGYEVEGWFGLFAPAGVPQPIIQRLNHEVVRILQDPKVKESLLAQGAEPIGNSPEAFATFVHKEHDRWAKTIRDAGITPQ
jgi:tripartite-type tricarboxylate transporter receptor subunit TctC